MDRDLMLELLRMPIGFMSEAGFDGVGLSFVNDLDELPYFRDEVLARLERTGLRTSGILV